MEETTRTLEEARKTLSALSNNDSPQTMNSSKKRTIPFGPYVPPHRRMNHQNIMTDINENIDKGSRIPQIDKNQQNKDDTVHRVLELANVYINTSIFREFLSSLYKDKYCERLSPEWLNTLKFCVNIEQNDGDVRLEASISNIEKDSTALDQISNGSLLNIPKVEVKDKEFRINIYSCRNSTELFGLIMDVHHLGEVEKLSDKMKRFYESEKSKTIVKEGCYYSLLDDYFYRVKCLKVNGSSAKVLFIDRGDEDMVSVKSLHSLDESFFSLPAQAVQISLSGLEVFADCDKVQPILEEILFDKTAYAEVLQEDEVNHYLSVTLYLKQQDEDINVNKLVMDEMCMQILDPWLFIKEDEDMPVRIVHIETGIFVQLQTLSSKYFNILMEEVKKMCIDEKTLKKQAVVRFDNNTTYFINNHNNWYRAKIVRLKNEHKFQVYLMDTGEVIDVDRENFILLEKLSFPLAKYPAQAIEVQLHLLDAKRDPKVTDCLRKLTSTPEIFYVRFIKTPNSFGNELPTVQLLKKTKSGFLASINDALLIDQKTIENNYDSVPKSSSSTKSVASISSEDSVTKVQTKKNTEVLEKSTTNIHKKLTIGSLLKAPEVPIGSYFDVHIVMASDPSRFVVQLLKDKQVELMKMNCDLTESCKNYKGPRLQHKSIKIGQLYACKSDVDHLWYRAYITQIIDEQFASVYYVDYGSYRHEEISNLVPLEDRFYSQPYQAFWGELHGAASSMDEWSVRDCLKFKDLTQAKDFVCIVKGKKDPNVQGKIHSNDIPITVETVYSLELIDTSTDEDIYLVDLLLNNKKN